MIWTLRRLFAAAIASVLLSACSTTAGTPLAESANASAPYTLGPGDKLRITVYGEDTLTGEYNVSADGAISFPLIGNVPAAGKTIADLQSELTKQLANGYFENPRVSAEILDYRPYYILGEVNRPGQYQYSAGLTIQQAVAAAGGFTYRANDDRIFLKRAMDTREKLVDLDKNPSFLVLPGDTIRVGERFF
ncbi:MAG TPA: polysaccharide biosynthesis/export family protein [Novosphingobium sp.]|nr:polysaccharide biosynthesis/export family protein [Novosphingobium sp.]